MRRRLTALITAITARTLLVCFTLTTITPAFAGGYVDGNVVLNPARAINTGAVSITPTFNNDQFNDQILVGTVNNDPIRTPSTADPVSTVTGNNYHDETDFVIKGRGLNYAFTRTYNSAPSSTRTNSPLGHGWSHSYGMYLQSNDFGDCPNCAAGTNTAAGQRPENGNNRTSSITYVDERGGAHNHLVNEGTLALRPPQGEFEPLSASGANQFTLTFRNGTRYVFESQGDLRVTPGLRARLKQIVDAWDNQLNFAYDAGPWPGNLMTVKDNLGIPGRTGLVFTYYVATNLAIIRDWTGRQWQYHVDGPGNLEYYANPLNQITTYGYGTDLSDRYRHRLKTITRPLARNNVPVTTTFSYYENGRTFNYKNALGETETLDYDLYRKSTRVTDPRGNVRSYEYDSAGRMTRLIEPDGALLLFENQNDAIRSKKYDALGYATTYSYRTDKALGGSSDTAGQVTLERDALGGETQIGYGIYDQIASLRDKRGTLRNTSFHTATDAPSASSCRALGKPDTSTLGSLTAADGSIAAGVKLMSWCWNADGTPRSQTESIDASNPARFRRTSYSYDSSANLNVAQITVTGSDGSTINTRFTYDTLGRKLTQTLLRRTSPTNPALIELATRYDYDALDRVTKTTDSLGNEAINSFDANGQLWQITHRYKSGAGYEVRNIVTRTFDAAERVKTEADADGSITSYSYDEAGNVIAIKDAEAHTTRFEYDAMSRRTATIDATGYRTQTTLTLRGDVVAIINANGESLDFELDALGRKTAAADALGNISEFRYDANGNLTCSIDANAQAGRQPKNSFGCTESRTYDELNRVIKITDALNGETLFTYDLQGNRTRIKDAELKTWGFAYDDLGRMTGQADHSGASLSYKSDEAGNLYEQISRLNETRRYSYDNANRLTRVDYLKDGSAEIFGYDPAGNRNAAANGNVSYSFTWDRLNRLVRKDDSRGLGSIVFDYGRVGNLRYRYDDNSSTSYTYNAANRLTQLRSPEYTQLDYQYDPAGRLLSRVSANGARTSYQYDANGWLTKLTQYDAANTLISSTTSTRDNVGNILSQTETAGPNIGTSTYTLDALYRLTSADHPGVANDEQFGYDKVGNRKSHTRGNLLANANTRYYNYTPGTNRLAEIRIGNASGTIESSFNYDPEGRLTSQSGAGAKTLAWDAKGRVSSVVASTVLGSVLGTTGSESYQYDPMDYRIGRSGGALGTRSYFLQGEHLDSEYAGGQLQARYFRGASVDELVAAYLLDADGTLTSPTSSTKTSSPAPRPSAGTTAARSRAPSTPPSAACSPAPEQAPTA